MLYDYRCRDCQHIFSKSLKMADRKQPEGEPCPECGKEGTIYQTILSAPPIGDVHRMGMKKPDAGFNEVLKTIKKGNPGSTINIRD